MLVKVRSRTRRDEAGGLRRRSDLRLLAVVCAIAATAISLAACGSSSTNSSSKSSSNGSSSASSSSSSSSSSTTSADVSAAKAAIAPYLNHPSPFPTNTPLKAKIPAGTKIAYLQCSAPICGLVEKLVAPAVKTLGGTLSVINSGATAQTAQAAASSVLAEHPAALLVTGIVPSEYGGELKKIEASGTKVVSISITGPTKQYGIDFNYVGLTPLKKAGALLADWVVANKGPKANVVFYGVPEIAFNPVMEAAFKAELSSKCPSCKLRFASLDITAIGTTAPQTIVSDLQSHPSINTAVFESAELVDGLPSALKSAGIDITTLGYTPQPEELEYIKEGELTAGLASDIATQIWTSVDIIARLILGEQPTAGEVAGFGPDQFLNKNNVPSNVSDGWTGYPNFAQMFAKLWNVG